MRCISSLFPSKHVPIKQCSANNNSVHPRPVPISRTRGGIHNAIGLVYPVSEAGSRRQQWPLCSATPSPRRPAQTETKGCTAKCMAQRMKDAGKKEMMQKKKGEGGGGGGQHKQKQICPSPFG